MFTGVKKIRMFFIKKIASNILLMVKNAAKEVFYVSDNILLEELFVCVNENKKNFTDLLKQINKHNVVPFIGAGMSIPIYPPWKKFFSDIIDNYTIRPSVIEKIKQLLTQNNYKESAQL